MYDYSDFVISIGCDTVFLLRKYYCIVAEKSSILRKFLSGVYRGIEFIKEFFIILHSFENRNAPYIAKFLLHKLFAI